MNRRGQSFKRTCIREDLVLQLNTVCLESRKQSSVTGVDYLIRNEKAKELIILSGP